MVSELAVPSACRAICNVIGSGGEDPLQVAQLLSLKLTQKTDAAQQWRKQALESGVLDASLGGLQSENETIAESCAGIVVPCRWSLSNITVR